MKAKKKVWPRKARYIRVPVYGAAVYLCQDQKTFDACRVYFTGEPSDGGSNGCCTRLTNTKRPPIYLLGVFDGKLGTLVHELGHLCFFVLGLAAVPVEPDLANEAYCYLLDEMYSLIAPRIKK